MPIEPAPQLPIVRPTHERRFGLMAESLLFRTNDERLLAAAEASFGRFVVPPEDGTGSLVVELFRDPATERPARGVDAAATDDAGAGDERVAHRVRDGLFLIAGPRHDTAVVRLADGVATGFVDDATVRATTLVRSAYVEAMGLSMLAIGRGYLTVHAAAVVRDGNGVVIHGPAGAGKSTLAMGCARRGFGVLAEDAVFVRIRPAGLELWGMPWTQRLLPDAAQLFPELAGHEARRQANGELKLEVDLDAVQPGRATPCAPAGPIVALRRGTGGPTRIEPLDDATAGAELEIHWPWDGGWTDEHASGARRLLAGGVARLHMNGTVDEAIDALERWLDGLDRSTPGR